MLTLILAITTVPQKAILSNLLYTVAGLRRVWVTCQLDNWRDQLIQTNVKKVWAFWKPTKKNI